MSVNFSLTIKGDKKAELIIYDVIGFGGISSKDVIDQLKAMGDVDEIHVRINSPGGSAFHGIAIYNALERHPAKKIIHIDAVAASAAALVAMAASPGELRIAANAEMMIHNGQADPAGDKHDLSRMIERLRSLDDIQASTFAKRMKVSKQEIVSMMDAETWFTADRAVAAGLADVVTAEVKIAACASDLYSKFKNVPADLAAQLKVGDIEMTDQEIQAKVDAAVSAAITSTTAKMSADFDAKLAAIKTPPAKTEPPADDQPSSAEVKLAERTRVSELSGLFKNAALKDEAILARWVDKDVSILEAKAEIGELSIKQNKLVEGEGGTGDDGSKEKQAELKARAEYREHPKMHATLGNATEEDYVKWRKVQIAAETAA